MRACLALCMAAALISAALADCGACIDGQCYKLHRLEISGALGDIDRNTNTLYFTDKGVIKQCVLNGTCNELNAQGVWRVAVDQRSGDIYYSGVRYIYKLNRISNEKERLIREKIYDMAFKEKIYYSPWYGHGIKILENGESRILPGTSEYDVYSFIIDKNDDIYFEHHMEDKTVIRRLSNGTVNLADVWESGYYITLDKDGVAVLIEKESHRVYRATNGQLTEVGVINDSINGPPLFDKDNNIIYKNLDGDFFHLKREEVHCE